MDGPKRLILAAIAILATLATAYFATTSRRDVARCPDRSQSQGARCCPIGQTAGSTLARCSGTASTCPAGLELVEGTHCVALNQRVAIEAGEARIGPNDWEAQGVVEPRLIRVDGFWLDSHEVTRERVRRCAAAGNCPGLDDTDVELGLPMRGLSADTAEQICNALGGRLPQLDEWIYAAATPKVYRYPWGQTGLVCRRASFGLESGPCAEGGTGPELAGMRPDGRSATGLFDMAGNVAEWVSLGEGHVAAGGSYRSRVAADLKSWATQPATGPSPSIGFRCAYDRAGAIPSARNPKEDR